MAGIRRQFSLRMLIVLTLACAIALSVREEIANFWAFAGQALTNIIIMSAVFVLFVAAFVAGQSIIARVASPICYWHGGIKLLAFFAGRGRVAIELNRQALMLLNANHCERA